MLAARIRQLTAQGLSPCQIRSLVGLLPPVNALPAASQPPTHDSGSAWLAKPSLQGSYIPNSLPVDPGAFGQPSYFGPAACGGRPMKVPVRGTE